MNKNILSSDIIDFLKRKNLYHSDNNIKNTINTVSNLENSSSKALIFIKRNTYDLSSVKSNVILANVNFKEQSNEKSIIFSENPQLAMTYIIENFFWTES